MRKLLLLAAAVILVAVPALGESVQTFVGSNVGGPTWHRPDQGNPPTTIYSGADLHYSVQSFRLLVNSTCYIIGNQTYDGYIHLYRNSFNPSSPLTNLISGDDDGILWTGTSYLPYGGPTTGVPNAASQMALSAGTYYLVTSSYSTTNGEGTFQNSVHCQPTTGSAATPVLVQGSCGHYSGYPTENEICLGEHFLVAVYDVTNSTQGGYGVPVRIGSTDTGLFWFYNDTNWELMVKVLDACGINNHAWVFGGALTNQGYNIVIHDWVSGGQKHYINDLGTRAPAIADTVAFDCP